MRRRKIFYYFLLFIFVILILISGCETESKISSKEEGNINYKESITTEEKIFPLVRDMSEPTDIPSEEAKGIAFSTLKRLNVPFKKSQSLKEAIDSDKAELVLVENREKKFKYYNVNIGRDIKVSSDPKNAPRNEGVEFDIEAKSGKIIFFSNHDLKSDTIDRVNEGKFIMEDILPKEKIKSLAQKYSNDLGLSSDFKVSEVEIVENENILYTDEVENYKVTLKRKVDGIEFDWAEMRIRADTGEIDDFITCAAVVPSSIKPKITREKALKIVDNYIKENSNLINESYELKGLSCLPTLNSIIENKIEDENIEKDYLAWNISYQVVGRKEILYIYVDAINGEIIGTTKLPQL